MTQAILLDTCALIWVVDEAKIAPSAEAELLAAESATGGLVVSPISAWEVGQLVARGRLVLPLEPRDWFQCALDAGLTLAPMTPDVLVAASFLPGSPPRDPADRILAATARTYRYRLMTRARPLLAFGSEGHLETIPC